MKDATKTDALIPMMAAMQRIRFENLARNMVEMATPTLIVMIVRVKRTDKAVLEVSSF